jgi:hypothetical protein
MISQEGTIIIAINIARDIIGHGHCYEFHTPKIVMTGLGSIDEAQYGTSAKSAGMRRTGVSLSL